MYKIPFQELKEKIVSSGKMSSEEFDEKIKAKINDLSGLISEEGAAHIIANELSIELTPKSDQKLKIKEIYSGMKNVSFVAKVIQKYDVREFNRNGNPGKVCSLFIGDETGVTRLVFWNEQVELISRVNPDDILSIENAYVRDNNGKKEIHMGREGNVDINPEGISIEVTAKKQTNFQRKQIQDLQGGEEGVELLGTVVQAFDPRFFYLCPECNKRAMEGDGVYNCSQHGQVVPNLSYVMNVIIDDGTGNIRSVFWKNQTNNLLGKEDSEISLFKEDMSSFEEIKNDLLGEQIVLLGRVKKNEMFNRLEFNVQIVNKADPKKEVASLQS